MSEIIAAIVANIALCLGILIAIVSVVLYRFTRHGLRLKRHWLNLGASCSLGDGVNFYLHRLIDTAKLIPIHSTFENVLYWIGTWLLLIGIFYGLLTVLTKPSANAQGPYAASSKKTRVLPPQ